MLNDIKDINEVSSYLFVWETRTLSQRYFHLHPPTHTHTHTGGLLPVGGGRGRGGQELAKRGWGGAGEYACP